MKEKYLYFGLISQYNINKVYHLRKQHSPAIEYACSYLFLKIIKVMYQII